MKFCRVCGSSKVDFLENVAFYRDFSAPVYDCHDCRSRFSESNPGLYDDFHSNQDHYYSERMKHWVSLVQPLLAQKDEKALLRTLSEIHFAIPYVIEQLNLAKAESILEVGCAWGYNSSYFLLKNFAYLGVDISKAAIAKASNEFGNFFCTTDDLRYQEHSDFDAIFHVGTIGCVEKPIEFTHSLLDKLRPGGLLIFNVPTRYQCDQLHIPWIWGACPPDLVTLFDDKFWLDRFGNIADIETKLICTHTRSQSLRLRLASRNNRQPNRGNLRKPIIDHLKHLKTRPSFLKSCARKIIDISPLPLLEPIQNAFGILVIMTKRD